MKNLHILLTLLLLPFALIFQGCGKRDSRPVLYIFNWAEYIDPELIEEFEEAHGCRVRIDTFDSNESMYAKLRAGASGYDLIFPTSYMATLMQEQGMLMPIPHEAIPNLQYVDKTYLSTKAADPKMTYSVPYMLGSTGLGVRVDQVKDFKPSWRVFEREDLRGRMMMLNDMREALGAALITLGHSVNTTNPAEINAARDLLISWKPNIAQFDNEAYKTALASGVMRVAQGYSGDVRMVTDDEDDVIFFIPEEGFIFSCDDMVIPKGAPNPELAAAFINFLHEPENAARNMEYVYYLCPNSAAPLHLSKETLADEAIFIPAQKMAKAQTLRDLGEANALYVKAWDEVKAAR